MPWSVHWRRRTSGAEEGSTTRMACGCGKLCTQARTESAVDPVAEKLMARQSMTSWLAGKVRGASEV